MHHFFVTWCGFVTNHELYDCVFITIQHHKMSKQERLDDSEIFHPVYSYAHKYDPTDTITMGEVRKKADLENKFRQIYPLFKGERRVSWCVLGMTIHLVRDIQREGTYDEVKMKELLEHLEFMYDDAISKAFAGYDPEFHWQKVREDTRRATGMIDELLQSI